MLAKNVNDNACFPNERGACEFFASKLAPARSRIKARIAHLIRFLTANLSLLRKQHAAHSSSA
ncbi:hypothetical protein IFR12_20745 [Pseudomonas fluorescens]|uniref:hypothetical protein n=1 Tax=Pseudomonas fluorescens TaxID=294 RepID=UPI00177A812C|nr:hypothetical protein [Pseudomonas fluorescens]MBD8099892.1 hypothetical protein [Pseudomonas fluorescens]MBD8781391.1 hypothetical protein [Pseudomonas fluorescens]MBD8796516.1 hypothetical protein [Pseudomonas fluorescens]